jgi:uncharacterized DUF497 family protein
MEIVWDELKRQANLVKHGLDFAALDPAFFLGALVIPGHSGRLRAIGRHDGQLMVAVIFRPRGSEAIAIISMRPANFKERRLANA